LPAHKPVLGGLRSPKPQNEAKKKKYRPARVAKTFPTSPSFWLEQHGGLLEKTTFPRKIPPFAVITLRAPALGLGRDFSNARTPSTNHS